MRGIFGSLVAFFLGACSATDVLNAVAEKSTIAVTRDVRYGEGSRRTLDIYAPREVRGAPIAIFYYGGGWESGDKESYAFVASALAAQGIVTVVPDYRVYPDARFPDFLHDAALAARWTKDHAGEFGGDPDRLVLSGHSAGAYIAAMLALDPQWLTHVGLDSRRDIAGTVGLAGPYDFLPLQSETLKEIFGPSDRLPLTQPIAFADGTAAPMLLISGGWDLSVDPGNSRRLADKIQQMGGEARALTYPLIGHALLLGAVGRPLRVFAPTLADTSAFIASRTPRPSSVIASGGPN